MRWQVREREQVFVKHDITRDVNTICGNMWTLLTLMLGPVTKEVTLFRTKLKFVFIVRSEVRPTCIPKNFEKHVVRSFLKNDFKW